MIKAIETVYKGYRFRSRLEAKWAILFDELGIKWEYEIEGFELENGARYLPDFYLIDFDCYAEVKPKTFSPDEFSKCDMLDKPCLLMDTTSPTLHYPIFITKIDNQFEGDPAHDTYEYYLSRDMFSRVDLRSSAWKKRLYYNFGEDYEIYWWDAQMENKAKSARFEYSEAK